MTIAIGIVDGNVIFMGCDSASVSETDCCIRTGISKVWRITVPNYGDALIGFSGNFATCQSIRYAFDWPACPKKCTSLIEYLVSKAQPALLQYIKKQFQTDSEWTLLFGSEKQLYRMYSDGDVESCEKPFMCIGDASDVANGVLYSSDPSDMPWTKMESAFEASRYFKTSVRGPFHIVELICNK